MSLYLSYNAKQTDYLVLTLLNRYYVITCDNKEVSTRPCSKTIVREPYMQLCIITD